MKYVLFGVLLSLVIAVLSRILGGADTAPFITGSAGLLLALAAAFSSGAAASGDRTRSAFASEPPEERMTRNRTAFRLLLVGLPCLLLSPLLYLVKF